MPPLVEGLREAYRQHAATLRNWFVVYGIGGPVLVVTHDTILSKVLNSGHVITVALLFFAGVFSQIFLAMCDKYADYILYRQELVLVDPRAKRLLQQHGKVAECLDRFAENWIAKNWPSIVLDVLTLMSFVAATVCVLWIVG